MKQKRFGLGLILAAGVVFMLFFGRRELSNGYFSTAKMQFLTNYMTSHYLYNVDENVGLEGIYEGYLSGLNNSATYYLNKDELTAEKACAKGNYFGTGLKLMWSLDEHALIVTDVVADSEADREGIKAGDRITQVADIPVLPANRKEITQLVTSKKAVSTSYTLERERGGMVVSLMPSEVEIEDVQSEIIDGVLYIHLKAVKEGTAGRLRQNIEKKYKESQGLILDLRDLQTDQVEEVSRIADLFLDGEISFKLQSKEEGVKTFTSDEEKFDMPIVVITNSCTLGGGEALVLALQGQATILGSDTGGMIYTRNLISFDDGTGMSVASGIICDRYGEALSSEGISPDIRLYLDDEDRIDKLTKGYLDKDSDSYLKAAVELFQ